MVESSTCLSKSPIQQLQIISNILENPKLARIYTYILNNESVSIPEIVENLSIPQGTIYDYIKKLESNNIIRKIENKRPYKYSAEPVSLTLSTDKNTITISPAFIATIAQSEENKDISLYIDRHGLDGLAVALKYTVEYIEGTVNHRIMARELDISPLEAEMILQALEPIVDKYPVS